MCVKWYTVIALGFTCLDVCYPFICFNQWDYYSPKITLAFRPLDESILKCTRLGGCAYNLCFEQTSIPGEPDYCEMSSGCWHFVYYNSTHQTCVRNYHSESLIPHVRVSTGVLLGGFVFCSLVGMTLFFSWENRTRRHKAFFVRHKWFVRRFIVVYFSSLALLLAALSICGLITIFVLMDRYCISDASGDDDD